MNDIIEISEEVKDVLEEVIVASVGIIISAIFKNL